MDDFTRERRRRYAAGLRSLLLVRSKSEASREDGYMLTAGDLGTGLEGAAVDEYFSALTMWRSCWRRLKTRSAI